MNIFEILLVIDFATYVFGTKELPLCPVWTFLKKWRGVDLNHRPVGYEPNALSTELPRQNSRNLKDNDTICSLKLQGEVFD